MKRILFISILLPLYIQAQVIELREDAYLSFKAAKPTQIMYSYTLRHPDPDRIMKCKQDNTTLLADVHTETEATDHTSDEGNERHRTLCLFDDKDDIEMLTEKYPKALIRWCYISDE